MSLFVSSLGVVGNLLFGYAGIPTAWRTFRARASIGTPVGLVWNIWMACIAFYAYTALTYTRDPLVWACGFVEIACYSVVLWFHYFPRCCCGKTTDLSCQRHYPRDPFE